jgi:8-oxo-dGTP pyrophosphatase MutT (NUDIX family)
MDIVTIRERLRRYQPSTVDSPGHARAAVALILRERNGECETLLIQRSERAHDPWSGHMALPGGREHPSDGDLARTATREAHEEIGIDLADSAELLGKLDDLQAIARDRPLSLLIRPFVYGLSRDVSPQPYAEEVRSTVWVPLSFLRRPDSRGVYSRDLNGGLQEFPAFVYQGYTIWGLTYRMLTGFLDLCRDDGT